MKKLKIKKTYQNKYISIIIFAGNEHFYFELVQCRILIVKQFYNDLSRWKCIKIEFRPSIKI